MLLPEVSTRLPRVVLSVPAFRLPVPAFRVTPSIADTLWALNTPPLEVAVTPAVVLDSDEASMPAPALTVTAPLADPDSKETASPATTDNRPAVLLAFVRLAAPLVALRRTSPSAEVKARDMSFPLDTVTLPVDADTMVEAMRPPADTSTLLPARHDVPCASPSDALRVRSRPAVADVRSIEPPAVTPTSTLDNTLPRATSSPAVRLMPPVLAVTLLPLMLPPDPITIVPPAL